MRDYGKVHSSFWTSETTRSMTEDGRALALYLLTSPHNTIAGVFRLPDGYVCEDMQWSSERVAKGFAELLAKGFANRCETTKWVWVCKHLDWNAPENPNQWKSAAKIVSSIPDECQWKQSFISNCWPQELNPSATVPKPFLNQEQEQKQEQEQEQKKEQRPPAARATRLQIETLPDEWRAFCRQERTDLDPERTFAKFSDYWKAKPGRQGVKLDWMATWRNWVRDERRANGANGNGKFNVHAAGRKMLAEALASEGMGDRPPPKTFPDLPE